MKETISQPFEILAPAAWTAPAVFNSPHSGSQYDEGFLRQSRLSPAALRKSEDCHVDELFMPCREQGAPLLRAHAPRCYIDLNREPYELDPRMFEDELPGYANTTSPRVAGGLGTIPRIVAESEQIYPRRLRFPEALARINDIYLPYHRALSALIDEVMKLSGAVLLVDCHSMPSSAVTQMRQMDVVVGDRFGNACDEGVTRLLEELLAAEGLRCVRNKPYAGGFITQTHGAPRAGRHALQIEINRALYMDERTLLKTAGFEPLRAALASVIAGLLRELGSLISPQRLAAE